MSGFGAPALMPTAKIDFANMTSVPGTILPSFCSVSMLPLIRISASACSPACTRFASRRRGAPGDGELVAGGLFEFRDSSSSTLLTPTVLKTLISAARDEAGLREQKDCDSRKAAKSCS